MLFLISPGSCAYSPANNTSPYAIACSSAPGGGPTQNFGLSIINITSGDIKTIYGGQSPASGVALSPDGRYLYLVNEMGMSISVMDVRNRTVIGTIRVGMFPQDAVVSPDSSNIYVSSAQAYYGDYISVINAPLGGVIASIKPGISPGKMALSPDGKRLYVSQSFYGTDEASSDIAVIDTTDHTVTDMIKTGKHPVSVAVSRDGSYLYAACIGSGVVSSIDATTGETIATAKVGRSPVDVAISEDGNTIYAVNDYFGRSFVSVIDASSMSIQSKIDLPGHAINDYRYTTIKSLAVGNNSTIYVTDYTLDAVYEINVTSGSITATINAGNSASGIVLSPEGKLYVISKGSGGVAVIDTNTGSMDKINCALSPRYVSILPTGKKAYITNGDIGTISVLDMDNISIISTIDAGGIMNKLTGSPDSKCIYVADTRNGRIVLIDTTADKITGYWNMSLIPMDIDTSPDGSIAYVMHQRKGADITYYDISKVDVTTGEVMSTYQLGRYAGSLTVSPDGSKLYAGLWESSTVIVMDSQTGRIVSRIKTPVSPSDIGVSPDGDYVYVACTASSELSIIDANTNGVAGGISLAIHPRQIAITPDGKIACVTGYDGIAIVDLIDRNVTKIFPVNDAEGIAVNPAMEGGLA